MKMDWKSPWKKSEESLLRVRVARRNEWGMHRDRRESLDDHTLDLFPPLPSHSAAESSHDSTSILHRLAKSQIKHLFYSFTVNRRHLGVACSNLAGHGCAFLGGNGVTTLRFK